ncbi:MAG: hypothetical protein QME42_01575, partial [bacterium]|nr:hypothetical protein [bacterium]
ADLNKEKEVSAQNKTELVRLQREKNSLSERISQLQTALSDSGRLNEAAVLEERNKLNVAIDSQKKRIAEAEENIKVLNVENLKIVTELKIEKETGAQNKIELTKLQQEKNSLSEKFSQFQTALSESNQAKAALLSERNELHIKVQELDRKRIELENDNKRLQAEAENRGESEDLTQEGFTTFISDTMRDLENKMSSCSADEDKKFVLKEMEIEAKVAMEKKGNRGIYVFPTAEKLRDIDSSKLQTIKFMIKSSPKIT